jgi:methylenetetrahydrofolate dehydrogenase (NADP+) / methenyltetrahydrofolate cyclohydrolase
MMQEQTGKYVPNLGGRHSELSGRPVAERLLKPIAAEAAGFTARGWPLRLVSISIGDQAPTELYVRNQKRVAERVGIEFHERRFPANVSLVGLQAAIQTLNADPRVSGIVLQRPVPQHLSIRAVQSAIHPLKDVEGMHPVSIGDIVYGGSTLAPCTALAAVELLRDTGLNFQGLEVTVIGHSEIVGKPVAFLLMAEGATVTVCHHMTRSVAMHSRNADAVIIAVGKPQLLTGNMIKPGSAIIDIGINQIGTDGEVRVVGDADMESCAEVAGWITPVPGGVGPVTVAMLMRNVVSAVRQQIEQYSKQFDPSRHQTMSLAHPVHQSHASGRP